MLIKTIRFVAKSSVICLPLLFVACNSGGSSSGTNVQPGNLVVTSSNSANNTDVVLGGTHQYIVTLANSLNFESEVAVTVTSSSSQIATIESNTCITQLISATQSCSFYVAGENTGNATITVSATNYQSVIESLTISQQWGTFSNSIESNIVQLSFGDNSVYALTRNDYVIQSNSGSWQQVGGGSVVTDDYISPIMASDTTRVCIGLTVSSGFSGEVKCSANGSNWQTLPVINNWLINNINLYQGRLYILAEEFGESFAVMSCPVDNCTSWQQQGDIFPFMSFTHGDAFFESTAFIQNETGTYYQASDGSWQLYGSYTIASMGEGDALAADNSGVALMPVGIFGAETSYLQPVYFNSSTNIGESYSMVESGIEVDNFRSVDPNNALVINNGTLFAAPGGDNIYSSTKIGESWSQWNPVGNNIPPVHDVFVNNNSVYSISNDGFQVYVYSLGSQVSNGIYNH